jgi:ribosome assembly protein 4
MNLSVQLSYEGVSLGPPLLLPIEASSDDLSKALKHFKPEFADVDFIFAANKRVVSSSIFKNCLEGTGASLENVLLIDCIKANNFIVKPICRTSATLSGHQGPVLSCSFSSDGSVLATGSGDKTVRLWDTRTMTPIKILSGHKGWILAISWSPCGSFIASGDSEGSISVWNRIGELIINHHGHKKWITCISWEPNLDSKKFVSASKDGTCRVWSISRTGCEVCMSHSDSVTAVRWLEDCRIVSVSHDRSLKLWKSTGELINTYILHSHWINSMTTNMDFKYRIMADGEMTKNICAPHSLKIATCSDDHSVCILNIDSSEKFKLVGHQGVVNHVLFSPNGEYLASASFDKSIKIWCGKSGAFIGNLRGHVGQVFQICWSADSNFLLSSSKDSTVKLWDIKTRKLKNDLAGHLDEVYCVDWSPKGEFAASAGKDQKVLMYLYFCFTDIFRWRN